MKAYTDLEQSKKLAEILPVESADAHYVRKITDFRGRPVDGEWSDPKLGNPEMANYLVQNFTRYEKVPCWSLAALLDVLPQGEYKDTDLCCGGYKGDKYIPEWFCSYEQQEPIIIEICHADNPVDACVAIIEKLHEQKIL